MKKSSRGLSRVGSRIALAILCLLVSVVTGSPPLAFAQQLPEPFVAIHVSEITQALETKPAVPPTPTGTGTTGNEWPYASWRYYVAYESLKEALRSDGTPFVTVSDSDIAAGKLLNTDGTPHYPILFSLMAEAVADNELSPLRDYVSAGGFLVTNASTFTRNPDGTARPGFAFATEMGLQMASPLFENWYLNTHFTKTADHRLTAHIPAGKLNWNGPLNSDEISLGISPSHVPHSGHYAWKVVAHDANVIATGDMGPLLSVKNYGLGQFIFSGDFQPIIGHGGTDPGMYSYLIYRKAIEWAFDTFSLPIVKASPWPFPYDAAFMVRHDFENQPGLIR